jgi:carboxymethylenebutenolidase
MADREIQSNFVKVPNDSLEIDAYLAVPQGDGPFPGIVVLQEIFGVNAHIRDVTERIAKAGYIAIAPALYQRQAPGFEVGYEEEDFKLGRQYKEQTKADELLSDIQAAIGYLKRETPVKTDGFGCIGFCFGGHVAYLAATLPEIQATAAFYGAGIPTMIPGGGEPTITRTKDISGTVYAFFGTEDSLIPQEHADRVEAALKENNIAHKIFRYEGADHGFFCDRRASYNEEAAKDAWEKAKQLFSQELS